MKLIIYGASGLANEIFVICKKINAIEKRWESFIFIDDFTDKGSIHGVPVYTFDKVTSMFSKDEVEFIIGIGEPSNRELLFKKVKDAGYHITTIIHPGVYIDETTKIGDGVVICEGTTITNDVIIGANSYIQPHSVIGHDIKIGSSCVIGSNSQIGGASILGDRVFMGFLSGVSDHITIGNDVIISAGAIVFREMPDSVICLGNPARIMKNNTERKVFK